MWLFTASVVKDPEVIHTFLGLTRESWAVLAQWASALAIVYAAWVAAHYQEKKEILGRKQLMRNHLAALNLFMSSVDGYFYIVFDGTDLPRYYDSTTVIRQAREEFAKFELKKEEIASTLPPDAVQLFYNFLSFYRTVDQLSHENDEDMYEAWKLTRAELGLVIKILEIEIEGHNNISKAFSDKTVQKTKK